MKNGYVIYVTKEHKQVCPIPNKYVGHYFERGLLTKKSPLAVGTFFTLQVSIVFCLML